MLTYNTQLKHLILPEYGRNIQQMVEHCLTITDRDERTRCAHSIVAAMGNLFPQLRETEESRRKLWDHLAIMADFNLDIDFPFADIVGREQLLSRPDPLPRNQNFIRLRHYGRYIEMMIEKAATMENGEERDTLVMLIANHMKKQLVAVNPDGVDDARVFNDLAAYSHGAIRLDPATYHLHEFQLPAQPQTSGKKKKKKKKNQQQF